ncbi:3-hydroxyacyl-ACP dehydratase FabZ [Blastochloris sulfoviridis]|uniref:3-hydroxyacyl-[acyl-carrier-protein] dehydratase FabZ n=1 Tax=Blastochloris sulfoviridis TaxID=50712 RepID=A0A5M6HYU9_9HYPH|nr:3-hydroxyacyl-ACP dehydratase FabZ [Blastochloris sulfoviridis]KAA5601106.1 3-hydroxyacyl-ACP dehydratase FabZ [Blastochloris sulfoviridis]
MTAETGKVLETLDIQRVLALLPHRYPFLLVDRIEKIDGDNSAVGIKAVTINEPHFQGHFPGRPVMPGVLLIEGMAQTAGAICILSRGTNIPSVVYFLTIDNCKFRRPVVPGDVVEFHMTKTAKRKNMWWYHGEAKVNGEIAAEADLGAMLGE